MRKFFPPETFVALNNNDKNKHAASSGTWKLIFKHFKGLVMRVFFF